MEKGSRRTGKTAWEIAQMYTDAFLADMKRLNIEDADDSLPRDRPHRRADRLHRRHRAQGLHVPDLRRRLFRHQPAARLRLPRAARHGRPGGGPVAWTWARSATRPTSRCGNSRRRASSGRWSGTARGARASPAGTSSARRWRRSISATTSTSTAAARTTSRSTTPTRSPRPRRACGTRLANFWLHGYFLLFNDAKMAKSAGEFLRVEVAEGPRLRSARVPLPVPHRPLPGPAQFHLGRARRRRHRARPDAPRRPRAARVRRRRTLMPATGRTLQRRDQRRPQRAARARDRLGRSARRSAAGGQARDAARVRSRVRAGPGHMGAPVEVVPDAVLELAEARAAARAARNWAEADRLRGELHAPAGRWKTARRVTR